MLKLLIAAIEFSCLTPGLAVLTFGSIGIQPVLLFLGAYCISFPLSGLQLPLQPILWALANVCGFLISYFLVTVTTAGQHSAHSWSFRIRITWLRPWASAPCSSRRSTGAFFLIIMSLS
jgi:hypothetical protein